MILQKLKKKSTADINLATAITYKTTAKIRGKLTLQYI